MLATAARAQSPPPSISSEKLVPLEVVINGAKSGTWVFVERGGTLYAPRDAFDEWRIEVPRNAPTIDFRGHEYLSVSAVAGFKAKIDYANQSVDLLFSPQSFSTMHMTKELAQRPPPSPVLPSAFFNYDMSFSGSRTRDIGTTRDLGVLSEVGVATQAGVLTSSSTARNLANDARTGVPRQWIRLETTFTRDFPEDNRTLFIGDTVTRGAMWGRDVYFGGLRYGTNYTLTPGLITQAVPALRGVSSAPSTVELYVNDVLRQVSSVPTGPFVIDNFPVLTGTGEARVVVRDLLGRETVVVQPFFTTAQLLQPGLDEWSVEAGRVRRDLGVSSDNYGVGFASALWRHGETGDTTFEGRIEAARTSKLIGGGMLTMLPWQVLARAALVGSNTDELGYGGHWLAGLEHQSTRWGGSVEVARSTQNFREVGIELPAGATKYQVAGNLLYNDEHLGTFGLGYASITRFDLTRIATISANYSLRIGKTANLSVNASRAIQGGSGSSVGMTMLFPLDASLTTSATAATRSGKQDLYVSAVRNPGIDSDLGWRALAGQQQNQGRAEAGAYYQGRLGSLSSDVSVSNPQQAVRLGAAGGIVWTDGHLFASRRVDASFALVEVPGYADVGIGLGSNVLTRTNADGVAIVPRLIPYVVNSIRIDPKELPISAEIESIEQQIVPAFRSGVKVAFPVRSGRGALLRIVLDDGEVAPAGAIVTIEGDKETFYVARRGEAFVTGIKPASRFALRWKDQSCVLAVTLPPEEPDRITRVGPLPCKGVAR